jgi:hypothetical protein
MRIQPPQKNKKRIAIIVPIVLLLLIGGYFAYAYLSKSLWPFTSVGQPSYEADDSTPGAVRTAEDDAESQDAKKRLIEEENNPSGPSGVADVTISSADIIDGNLEVRAFTDSVIEAGECTVTATKGSITRTSTSPAFIDARPTICRPMTIDESQLSAGTWNVVVAFKSASAQGTSNVTEVNVP